MTTCDVKILIANPEDRKADAILYQNTLRFAGLPQAGDTLIIGSKRLKVSHREFVPGKAIPVICLEHDHRALTKSGDFAKSVAKFKIEGWREDGEKA